MEWNRDALQHEYSRRMADTLLRAEAQKDAANKEFMAGQINSRELNDRYVEIDERLEEEAELVRRELLGDFRPSVANRLALVCGSYVLARSVDFGEWWGETTIYGLGELDDLTRFNKALRDFLGVRSCIACDWFGPIAQTVHPKHDPTSKLCPRCYEVTEEAA